MNTVWMLMARYEGRPVIPVDEVRRDHFTGYDIATFLRKLASREIALPVVRLDPGSQKGPKGIPLADLAAYLDTRIEAARKEAQKLAS